MRDLKQIQKQQQAQEAQEQQEAQEKHKGPQAERSDASSAERGPLLRRGDQLPDAMASDESLRVKDWQQSRLPEPGEGQRWIQLKSGYVLTDIQSGVIEEILLGP
jgi:Ni/Co efflux regulator RcnB